MAYKKGQSGNPKGRPKGASNNGLNELRKQLQGALNKEGRKHKKTFLAHVAEQAYKDRTVLSAVLSKLLPDLKSVDANIKADGMKLIIECNMKPKWKNKGTS